MEIIYILLGIIVGICIIKIIDIFKKVQGTITVDHESGLCSVFISTDKLTKTSTKRVIFEVRHDAILPREEQGL